MTSRLIHPSITKVDYILVGQGLAGSCLALRLLKEGKQLVVFDEPARNRSSQVAAGLFNPITGKVMSKTWLADELFRELFSFYREAERDLGESFFFPQPLYRPFLSAEEQNEWMGKSAGQSFKEYVQRITVKKTYKQCHDPFGGILLATCGYLDVPAFLDSVRNRLRALQAFREERFDFSALQTGDDHVTYGDRTADKIIFCHGIHAAHQLPIRLLKGETLTIELEEEPEVIFNRGVYVVPTRARNTYKVGATYETKNLAEGPTVAGRAELEQKLKELISIPYRVTEHDWGFRPTVPDRRPLLGRHPDLKNVVIFNGLGTKGVSLAPYFSAQLASWLLGRGEIQPEVNINRFKSLSSKSSEVA